MEADDGGDGEQAPPPLATGAASDAAVQVATDGSEEDASGSEPAAADGAGPVPVVGTLPLWSMSPPLVLTISGLTALAAGTSAAASSAGDADDTPVAPPPERISRTAVTPGTAPCRASASRELIRCSCESDSTGSATGDGGDTGSTRPWLGAAGVPGAVVEALAESVPNGLSPLPERERCGLLQALPPRSLPRDKGER